MKFENDSKANFKTKRSTRFSQEKDYDILSCNDGWFSNNNNNNNNNNCIGRSNGRGRGQSRGRCGDSLSNSRGKGRNVLKK